MTFPFQKGRYMARFAQTPADVVSCQTLRHLSFFGRAGLDTDRFDSGCQHLMVTDPAGRLLATVRLWLWPSGAAVRDGYAAQYYDLAGLSRQTAPLIEIGRFCLAPDVQDADVVRVAWGALTHFVDEHGTALLFGCTSFAGVDPVPHARTFARLMAKHLGPAPLRPRPKAAEVVHFADIAEGQGDAPMPPLLRSYLAMGGWVGDHAVVDRQMNTLHVFTCVDVAAVPPARARALRAVCS